MLGHCLCLYGPALLPGRPVAAPTGSAPARASALFMQFGGSANARQLQEENEELQKSLNKATRAIRIGLPGAIVAVGIAPRVLTPTNNPAVESAAETARMRVVDKRAEDAMATYFPKSIGSLTVDR